MKLRILVALSLSAILLACASPAILEPIPCPPFPELIQIDEEMEADTPDYVVSSVIENYIRLIEYAEKLEVRAGCGDTRTD